MKNKKFYAVCLATLLSSSTAMAEGIDLPGDFSGSVTAVTQYSFRGITQSNEEPAIQGSFDWAHENGFYLGVWGSSVDFTDAQTEFDIYGGYNFSISNLDLGVGFVHYLYPGAADNLNYDFTEAVVSIGHDFGSFSASGSLNYSPEFFGESGDAYYYNLGVDVPLTFLPYNLGMSGTVGYQDIDDEVAFTIPDYMDWSIGLGTNIEGFDLALVYKDTDLKSSECADGCDAAVIFSITRSF